LNKLSQERNIIEEYYYDFKEDTHITKDNRDNLYVLGRQGMLSMYNKESKSFTDLPINKDVICRNVSSMLVDVNDTIWINHNGILEKYTISFDGNKQPHITRHEDFIHPYKVEFMSKSRERFLFVDSAGGLYSINPRQTVFIRDISSIVKENGFISSIIYDYTDILIAFRTNGLFRLQSQNNYTEERIDINCGVFSLWKDEDQDIIWIGTDGQGVYAWTKDDYTFRNLTLPQLPIKKQRPIRAISSDNLNNLWLGTKDNGVVCLHNYNTVKEYTSNDISHYTTNNGLVNNNVFALEQSKYHQILWIGSDGPGINYFSYRDKRMHRLANESSDEITFVHSLFEGNDSILWIGSGNSLMKIRIKRQGHQLAAKETRRFLFELKNNQPFNQIYSLYQENDTCIWIGMRGNGIIKFNPITERYRLISFEENGIAPMNDILCIFQHQDKTLWLGTSYGLIRFNMYPDGSYDYKNYNENDGLPNNTIHGILEAPDGKLWLSSNTGIILFDPAIETFRNFNHKTGLKIIEFSDNAYFTDRHTSVNFFGGVDGLVWIKQEEMERKGRKRFIPNINFTRLRLFNQDYNIADFEMNDRNERYIRLKHRQNFFSISFVAMDFINGANSSYSYRLKNFKWMDTHSNEAQFTNISPGDYILEVKYNDGTGNSEDQIESIRVVILPPWYQTVYARIVYILLTLAMVYLIFYFIQKKYEKRKQETDRKLKEKYKEEMYEGKLRFFTNITHELSTPLTLIYGPCERILANEKSDSIIKKYAGIIKSNTERLNMLIQEIIDFRRMETGHKICHITPIDISGLTTDIVTAFNDLAEQNDIHFQSDIPPDIRWNTDTNVYAKILNNLISNAFKYTPPQGQIIISLEVNECELTLRVYNTGKGIEESNIPLIFNRYSVLDNIKENNIKGLSSRNGLGLAICHSSTELLGGTIRVESEVNKFACFIVTLPYTVAKQETENHQDIPIPYWKLNEGMVREQAISNKETTNPISNDGNKKHILIIDDNSEMQWMLKEILSDEYNITVAGDGEKGLDLLKRKTPDLIITDIMMPNMDGITLTRYIKENKHTMHIPLVILSARNANEEKIEGIESGADIYIPKPFNTDYLKAVIRHLIERKKKLEDYYNSSASGFEFADGQLLPKEDKDFLQIVTQIVNKNMNNVEFNTEDLAENMQISIRKLYRKFKELNQLPPNDFIKDLRLRHTARLLLTTTLTIQEIMYQCGFINRSHFYKAFTKKFNQTPKEYRTNNKTKDDSLA
jgi:signal transduction histidine kinase/DNA-binding response OmpR family regulator/ligand-binding sensor domain-containing protein